MQTQPKAAVFSFLTEAATDSRPVTGWTHNFYRYPARFSPQFAAAAIECFSQPTDLVLDPYMGGATTVVEGIVAGRKVIGNDLNSLAAFIAKVKTTALSAAEIAAIRRWAVVKVPEFSYCLDAKHLSDFYDPQKTRNLTLSRARFIKKVVAAALSSIEGLRTENSRAFARCIVLRVGQWALDGRVRHTPLSDFREKLTVVADEMLDAIQKLAAKVRLSGGAATILNVNAADLDEDHSFKAERKKVSLVVTSPPYPGVHVLYHRWQVDGRRETPAPYWIAGCRDGQGASFYNFGDRRETAADTYFEKSLLTLQAVRRVMRTGGYIVQLVAFNRPSDQLPRYLANMEVAGFAEMKFDSGRIWRQVPQRKWYAAQIGRTDSANEVVLIHRAV